MHATRPTETWKSIPGYEGYYEVSDHGRVRSLDRVIIRTDGQNFTAVGKVLTPIVKPTGHLWVGLMSNSKRDHRYVHRLVIEAFTGPCPPGRVCRHLDGNPANNHISNLAWGTPAENLLDSVAHGTHKDAKKSVCIRGHLLAPWNLTAYSVRHGKRQCRSCHNAAAKKRRTHLPIAELADDYYRRYTEEARDGVDR